MSTIYRFGTPTIPEYVTHSIRNNKIYDPCEMCDAANVIDTCNKCGSGVCDDKICSLDFPHWHDTTLIICASCVEKINKKLIPLIDLGKLQLLKAKIKNNATTSSVRTHSRSRSSGSSISSEETVYSEMTENR